MSGSRKGGEASGGECGCEGNAGKPAANAKREGWGRVLDSLWPKGMPFPPAAPWAGAVVKRSQLVAVIEKAPDSLPFLPISAAGQEIHPENLQVIAELIDRGMAAQHRQGAQMMAGPEGGGLGRWSPPPFRSQSGHAPPRLGAPPWYLVVVVHSPRQWKFG